MSKPSRILLTVLLVLSIGSIIWFFLAEREPAYQGRGLRAWMGEYEKYLLARKGTQEANRRDEAHSAIREIGTNALPVLLRMVGKKDSPLKKKIIALWQKQSLIVLTIHDADYFHAKASYGLGALGPMAKPAVPAFVELLRENDAQVRAAAALSLSFIGPDAEEAVPALLPLLDERGYGINIMESMHALGMIHKQPEVVLPRLMEFVNGERKDWNYAVPALEAIRWYRADAKELFPIIESFLYDQNTNIRDAAMNALYRIDGDAAEKAMKVWREKNESNRTAEKSE